MVWVGLVWSLAAAVRAHAHAQAEGEAAPERVEPAEGEAAPERATQAAVPANDKLGQRLLELATRVSDLESREGAKEASVAGPLATTKVAIERARLEQSRADEAAALRAERIARASLALAERRWSLAMEQGLKRAALARLEHARERAAAARLAREAAAKKLAEPSESVPGAAAVEGVQGEQENP